MGSRQRCQHDIAMEMQLGVVMLPCLHLRVQATPETQQKLSRCQKMGCCLQLVWEPRGAEKMAWVLTMAHLRLSQRAGGKAGEILHEVHNYSRALRPGCARMAPAILEAL